jgi:hypothetical protein
MPIFVIFRFFERKNNKAVVILGFFQGQQLQKIAFFCNCLRFFMAIMTKAGASRLMCSKCRKKELSRCETTPLTKN